MNTTWTAADWPLAKYMPKAMATVKDDDVVMNFLFMTTQ